MLELDAERRITATQALAHPYVSAYADLTDEPVSPPYDQSFEDMELPVEKWKGTSIYFALFKLSYEIDLYICFQNWYIKKYNLSFRHKHKIINPS